MSNFARMEWLVSVFSDHTALQAVVILSVIIACGLAFGKIRIFGVSLGVTFVFFVGILAGHLGFSIDPAMLSYAESFGLVLFIYELGLKVGPGFFSAFRQGGVKLNLLGLAVIIIGTLMTIGFSLGFHISISDMVGVLCGATTNTPALGAAQQALEQLGQSASDMALGCAVSYPLGVVGVIIAIAIVKKVVMKSDVVEKSSEDDNNHTFIAAFRISNPAIFSSRIKDVAKVAQGKFVISRLWHDGRVSIPGPDSTLYENDRILAVTTEEEIPELRIIFGEQEQTDWNTDSVDWNAIDANLESRHIVISKPEFNGRKLGSLHLRNNYGINVSRVSRAGVSLLATPGLVLQLGDRLTVVGEAKSIDSVAMLLGNADASLKDPNLGAIFVGIVLGLVLGSIPFVVPGISTPIKLGLAGGPIIVGILIGRFGPQMHLVTYTTRSANLMLRGIGLSLFLACLGLDSGAGFLDTIMRADGLLWIGLGFLITVIPSLLMLTVSVKWFKVGFGSTCGMVCGAMANPMALDYASGLVQNDSPAVSYATTYPLGMFLRVVLAQILVLALA